MDIVRFKGLGEMQAEELYSTTMDPENRTLVQLTIDDMESTLKLYNQLMGKTPALRRDFIARNKLSKYAQNEDDDIYEDEEGDE